MSQRLPIPHVSEQHEQLWALAAGDASLPARLDRLSEALLGCPYLAFSLVGGPAEPERLVTRLDGLDCVTFTEVVLALGASRSLDQFVPQLLALRYHHGRLSWAHRNHYTHTWLDRNTSAGRLRPLLPQLWSDAGAPRRLDLLEGYPALEWQPRYLPWSQRGALALEVQAGDWVGFVSNKPNLDTFHVGLLFPDPLRVRHASRSQGQVVEEDLAAFMSRWDVPGVLVARPLTPPGGIT